MNVFVTLIALEITLMDDGFPIEFYKTFQSIISDSFIWIALVQVQKKSSFLKKQAIITLKEKLEIDLQSPSLMYM